MGILSGYTPYKTSIADDDVFILEQDTPNKTLGTLWSSVKSTLKTYFDTFYQSGSSSTKTGNFTILDTGDNVFYLAGASGDSVFTLPTLADNLDREITCFNNDTTYELNVDGEGAETIDGMTDFDLPKQGNYLKVKATAAGWVVIDEAITCQLWLNTSANYGSSDTAIEKFTNAVEDTGNMFSHNHGSYGTDGLEVTFNRSGVYSISYSSLFSGGYPFGLSVDSAALSTSFTSIPVATRVAGGFTSGNNNPDLVSVQKRFYKTEVMRPHCPDSLAGSAAADDRAVIIISYIGQ